MFRCLTLTCSRTFSPVSQASTVATSAKNASNTRQRIRDVERSTFCPLIWSTSGGAGPAATCFLKRLADKLSERTEEPYSTTVGWLRCRLGFALTRSAVMCLRGSRSRAGQPRCAVEPALASASGGGGGGGGDAHTLMFRCLTLTCSRTFSPVSQASTVATSAKMRQIRAANSGR